MPVSQPNPRNALATNPLIVNVTTNANVESSYLFPDKTKKFILKARGTSITKISYIEDESNVEYVTLHAGSVYEEEGILSSSLRIYFQTSKNDIIEISSWI